jgi:hypothetical protein
MSNGLSDLEVLKTAIESNWKDIDREILKEGANVSYLSGVARGYIESLKLINKLLGDD